MLVNTASVVSSALTLVALGYAIGLPASKYFDRNIRMRLLIAPAIGLGIFGAAGVSIFHLLPMTAANLLLIVLSLSVIVVWLSRGAVDPILCSPVSPGFSWLAVAFLLCLLPTLAIIPQYYGASASVGEPIFDHAKIAIINELAQNGLPPRNPYYSEAGSSNTLIYYYIWYFIAACSSIVTGAGGWEADIALTAVTALSSMFVVTWLAVAQSKSANAAWWVLPLLLASSLGEAMQFASGRWLDNWLVQEHLRTWFVEAAWAPQHLFSATVALLIILAYVRILQYNTASRLAFPVLIGAMLASAYGSSTWVGGFSLLLVLPIIGILSTPHVIRSKRTLQVVTSISVIAGVTVLCSGVLVYEQSTILHTRNPVEFWVFPVFVGRNWLIDVPGFWLVQPIVDFGIIFVSFLIWCRETVDGTHGRCGNFDRAIIITVLSPLVVRQFVHSVILYNDLGYHVVMPSMLLLMAISASLLSRHIGKSTAIARLTTVTAIIFLAPSILVGARYLYSFAFHFQVEGPETEEAKAFISSPEMWEAVRLVTPPNEAVANNPRDLASLTVLPGNISWATLSQRRNCATTLELLRAFASQLTPKQASYVDDFFVNVFRGNVTEAQLRVMKENYLCKTLVVTVRDGLWGKPILNDNSVFQLVSEEKGKWRIYR
ncbi:hypothetical protein [Mesorhizobium sp. M1348]|uniref:hypothetical protein n=1 Tax=Mesorhizobium sp. M1348 TaxID=2957089 RepID=UPI003335826C